MANNEDKHLSTPENLVQISPESKPTTNANDLNKRINGLENTLASLKKQLKASQDSVKETLAASASSEAIKNQITDTLKQLAILDKNYQSLIKNTADISSENKKIASRLTTHTRKQTLAVNDLENKLVDELGTRLNDLSHDLQSQLHDTHASIQHIKTSLNTSIQETVQSSENRDQELTQRADDMSEATIKLANTLDILSQELTTNINELAQLAEQRDADISKQLKASSQRSLQRDKALEANITRTSRTLSDEIQSVKHTTTEQKAAVAKQIQQLNTDHDLHTNQIKMVDHDAKERDQSLFNTLDELGGSFNQQQQHLETLDKRSDEQSQQTQKLDLTLSGQSSRIEALGLVDEKMALRAQQLEVSTDKLGDQTISLEKTASNLRTQTESLLHSVSKLSEQTDTLAESSEKQHQALANLSFKESRHYNLMKGSLVLLALLTAGGFIYEQGLWQNNEVKTQTLEHTINTQQLALENSTLKQRVMQQTFTQKLSQQQAQQQTMSRSLQHQIDELKGNILGINDGVDSLDGRLVNIRPNQHFGGDNIIHGAQWLQQQNPSQFAILLTQLSNKQAMYDTASRYSHYLQQKLAYYTVEEGGVTQYILVYGAFDSHQQAASILWRLPSPNAQQRPFIQQMARIQASIH